MRRALVASTVFAIAIGLPLLAQDQPSLAAMTQHPIRIEEDKNT
jgi:hypothetical protein